MTELNSILENSVEKYRNLIHNISDVIAEIDLNGIFTYVSPQVYTIFGYKPEELIGAKFFSFIHPDDMPSIIETFEKAINSKKSWSFDLKVRHKEGHYINVLANGNLVKIDDNLKIVCILKDITERIKQEQALKDSEESFKNIADSSLVGINIIQNNYVVYTNDASSEIIEYSVEEIENWSIQDLINLIDQEDLPLIQEKLKLIMEEPKDTLIRYSCRLHTKSGKLKWVEIFSKNILFNGNEAILSSIIDVSEKKQAEKMLKESEELFRKVSEKAYYGIILTKSDGRIYYWNKAAENIFGYSYKDTDGKNIYDLIIPEDYKAEFKKGVEIFKKTGQLSLDGKVLEYPGKKKDGTLVSLEISFSKVRINNQWHALAIFRDITERKKVETKLKEINQLKLEILERTSHELKTPLISIKGFTDLLLDLHKEKFDTETVAILDEIKQGAEKLEAIINKFLETSYLESGKVQINPIEDDLSFLIKFCVKNLRGLANTRNLFISLDVPEKLIVKFEKEKLHEVVSHLIINAIKYTPPFGEIKVQSEINGDFIVVSVEDSGIGLTEEEKNKIFKQFGKIERYGQGWDIGIEGTGMGLYTSKKIVELHGGKIWAESEGKNMGSKFCFSLPFGKD